MNLSERFWKTLEEKHEEQGPPPEGFDLLWHVVRPAPGEKSAPAKELGRLARISCRTRPPALLSQPSVDTRPFALIVTAPDKALPTFDTLYEGYLDKNGYLAECLMLVRPHCDVPYALFVGPQHFYLYDLATEDILRWSPRFEELEELIVAPVERRESVREVWDKLARRSRSQRAEEFAHWLDLWRVAIGAHHPEASSPHLIQAIFQKAILLFVFDLFFGFTDEDLQLRRTFLAMRQRRRQSSASDEEALTFDSVAWLHQASQELLQNYRIEFLRWSEQECAFFSLMNSEARLNLRQFIFELFLQSQSKFDTAVQAEVFSDPDARLKMWRFSVTETLDVRKRLQADDVNVYAPLEIDLDESGLAWALHVAHEVLDYWREKCEDIERELERHNRVALQFDMFQQPDLASARVPTRADLFRSTLPQSLRVFYSDPVDRTTYEYLLTLQIFDYCRRQGLPLQPLDDIQRIFVPKPGIPS